jgi:uncharacterized protein YndB with AHSA1/START domain
MRTDSASRVIKAPTRIIYRALLNPGAIVVWRAPAGMTALIDKFELREGGTYRMVLSYETAEGRGKTTEREDVVRGKFVKLVTNEKVVEDVEFETADPAFQGAMTITTTLVPVLGGTKVTVTCENVPGGIKQKDHRKGMESSLDNLAAFAEKRAAA